MQLFTCDIMRLRFSDVNLSVTSFLFHFCKQLNYTIGDPRGKERRDSVADLLGNLNFCSVKLKPIGESLKSCSLTMCDRAMLSGMEVSSLLRLIEFRSDCVRRLIPPKTAKEIGSTFRFSYPTTRRQFRGYALKVKPIHSFFRYGFISLKAYGSGGASKMQIKRRRGIANFRPFRRRQILNRIAHSSPRQRSIYIFTV